MGIDSKLFTDAESENFLCCMCYNNLEFPLQIRICKHIFCSSCICRWLSLNNHCPLCRQEFYYEDLQKLPKPMYDTYKRLTLKCPNELQGCKQVMTVKDFKSHCKRCTFQPNPDRICTYCSRNIYGERHSCWRLLVQQKVNLNEGVYVSELENIDQNDIFEELFSQIRTMEENVSRKNILKRSFISCAVQVKIFYRKLGRQLFH